MQLEHFWGYIKNKGNLQYLSRHPANISCFPRQPQAPPNWTGVAGGLIAWEPGMTSSREISSTRFF